jgi:ABC-type multidrug transport system fused ATPase/permease subunit
MIGIGIWIFGYMYFAFWQHLAENISFDLRKRFLAKLLVQEIAYFEKQQVEALPSLIGEYFSSISGAVGEKLSNIISTLATVVFGIAVGLGESPVFGVINLGFVPVILLTVTVFGGAIKTVSFKKLEVSRQLGGMIEENLTAIKLIVSFAQEKKACDKYAELAAKAKVVTMKSEKLISIISGMIRFEAALYTTYAYWIGAHFIQIGRINERTHEPQGVGDIISVQMAMMLGVMTFMALNPNIQALAKALAVGVRVFDVIDREPEIIDRPDCKNDYTLKEAIRFEGVTFKYPTAPDHVRNVLQNSSFNIKVGSSTAIVGPSGSGKSTIVQMIERFYNPSEGEIYFDNVNIKDITLKGLRESIGYVSQEPVLILGTIKDNILFGNVDATEAEIHEALSKANATFVFEMENGLETYIGSASVLNLSGGQK